MHACVFGGPLPLLRLRNFQGQAALRGGDGDAAVAPEDHGHRNCTQERDRGKGASNLGTDLCFQGTQALPQQDVAVLDSSKESSHTHETNREENRKETQEEEKRRCEDETNTCMYRNLSHERGLRGRPGCRWKRHEHRRRVSGARRRRRRRGNEKGDVVLGRAAAPPPEAIQGHNEKATEGRNADEESKILEN